METEKPFHSKEFMQQELDNLLNAPERPTWDEFKEQQRKKGEMEGTMDKVEQEAQGLSGAASSVYWCWRCCKSK